MESQLLNQSDLLKTLLTNNLYEKAINQANRKYKIKHYRIEKLKPSGIKNILKKNLKKQKLATVQENNYAWAEGQLKIFIWFLVGYVYIKKIDICDLNESDFYFFTEIFEGYSIDFLHYQAKFLVRNTEKVVWTQKEAKMLNSIIKAKFQQKNWNTVAYELYLLSEKTVFRTPKQCRQRWLNHEDPNKIHSQWTIQEDIELLRFVKSLGKKWSLISRTMKSTRTEHMVKNRFTSLIRKVSKNVKLTTETEFIEMLLKTKISQKQEKDNELPSINEFQSSEIMSSSNDSTIESDLHLELQEIEMTQEDLAKKGKEEEFFFPYNLVAQQASEMEQQPILRQPEEIINFYQVEKGFEKEMFASWFD